MKSTSKTLCISYLTVITLLFITQISIGQIKEVYERTKPEIAAERLLKKEQPATQTQQKGNVVKEVTEKTVLAKRKTAMDRSSTTKKKECRNKEMNVIEKREDHNGIEDSNKSAISKNIEKTNEVKPLRIKTISAEKMQYKRKIDKEQ